MDHPDIPTLIAAEKDGRTNDTEGLVRNITREGRRKHLATLRATDARAFFNFLAKAEGRIPAARGHSCNAPLIDEQGCRQFDAPTKCELLAEHFGKKLNMPGLNGLTTWTGSNKTKGKTQGKGKGQNTGKGGA